MDSINPDVNSLFHAYNSAMGLDLMMNGAFERWLTEASNAGLSPEDFELAIRARQKFNSQGGFRKGTLLHHFVMGEDAIGITLNEAAVAKAQLRVRVMESAKASVLRQTHRPTDLPQKDPEQAKEILKRGMEDLRKAIEP